MRHPRIRLFLNQGELGFGKSILGRPIGSRVQAPEIAGAADEMPVRVMSAPPAVRAWRPHQVGPVPGEDVVPIEHVALRLIGDRLQEAEEQARIGVSDPSAVLGCARAADPTPPFAEVRDEPPRDLRDTSGRERRAIHAGDKSLGHRET